MKIGILTLPLHTNYGGLLQAYALQVILQRMGHDVHIINRDYKKIPLIGLKDFYIRFRIRIYNLVYHYYITSFIKRHHRLSRKVYTSECLSEYIRKNSLNVVVVGSDQVWRPQYSPCITDYYLGVINDLSTKRIAYAASFGVNEWEYTTDEAKRCADLAKQFDAISVREESAIGLCRNHLGVEAKLVLDPTLLLEKEFYEGLILNAKEKPCQGELFCYVLDQSKEVGVVIKAISNEGKMQPYYCYDSAKTKMMPSVTRWLRCFMDAKMVVTDSFHGTVFSIIFNKPFWVVGNERRGMDRFNSILKLLGLQDRLVSNEHLPTDWNAPIAWGKVNHILSEMQSESLAFLKAALNN